MKLQFHFSAAHLAPHLRPTHGPQQWPFWRLFSLKLVRLEIAEPSIGHRLWVYSRWGALFFDVVQDRRALTKAH